MTIPRYVGTAGWAIPRIWAERFPQEGSTLTRYAALLNAAEINTTFYRQHRPATFERWAASTPPDFRFSVKMPRSITHEARLVDVEASVEAFLQQVSALGSKLGVLLVQLPASLPHDPAMALRFFRVLRDSTDLAVAFEPRHPSWLEPEVDAMLRDHRVARVAADPARPAGASAPGGWPGLVYFRLHGSPRMYVSPYEPAFIETVAAELASVCGSAWCIFDNTLSGAAANDALKLKRVLEAV